MRFNTKKIFIGFISFIVIFISACVLFAFIFKDKIIETAQNKINENLNAKIAIGSMDVSMIQNIKNFPDLSLILKDVRISGKDTFEKDTLIQFEKTLISIDIMSILKSKQYKINAIELYNATLNPILLSNGSNNWSITKSEADDKKEERGFNMSLKKIVLENINIQYDDYASNQFVRIKNLNHHGKGDFSDTEFDYISDLDIASLSYSKGLISFLKNTKLHYDGNVKVNNETNSYIFEKNTFSLNALKCFIDGSIQKNENQSINTNIEIKADQTDFKDVLSLIPAIYSKDFDKLNASGSFNFLATFKGIYQENRYPKTDILLSIKNGAFQYPSLPKKVSQINIESRIQNPGGSGDLFTVNIPKFSMLIGNDPFNGHLKLWQLISNPNIDLTANGKINLSDISKLYPMEGVKTLQGLVDIDLNIQAQKKDIEAKNYQAIKASGKANIKNLKYESITVGKMVVVDALALNFTPQYVDMPVCKGKIESSDFDMKGKLENVIAYYMSSDAHIKGNLIFNSNFLDANAFLSEDNNESTKRSDYVMVPKNIDFVGQMNIKKMNYGKMQIQNLNGTMEVAEEVVRIKNVDAELLGGKATMNGFYSTVGQSFPKTELNYDVKSLNLTQVFNQVESAQKIAPLFKYMDGFISSKSNISTELLPDLSPNLNTMNGNFTVQIPLAKVNNAPLLQKIAEVSRLNQLQNLEIQNINANVKIEKGRVILNPLQFKANNMNMSLGGSHGIDQSMDYKLGVDVPFEQLGPANTVVNGLLSKVNLPFLNQIKPEIVRMNINMKGMFDKPNINLGTPEFIKKDGSTSSNATESVVNDLKEKGAQAKKDLILKADTIKENIKKEVDKKVEETKKQVEEEVNKKKNEVLDKLKKKLPW
jgi:hypothetical protein